MTIGINLLKLSPFFLLLFVLPVSAYDIYTQAERLTNYGNFEVNVINGKSLSFPSLSNGQRLYRGQCGEFVNDLFIGGPGIVKDSFLSKKRLINELYPRPGFAFIEYVPGFQYGHIGLIVSVNEDSIDIIDSNARGDEKIQYTNIPFDSKRFSYIVGYYNPYRNIGR